MVDYSLTLVDIKHLINLKWLTLVYQNLNTM